MSGSTAPTSAQTPSVARATQTCPSRLHQTCCTQTQPAESPTNTPNPYKHKPTTRKHATYRRRRTRPLRYPLLVRQQPKQVVRGRHELRVDRQCRRVHRLAPALRHAGAVRLFLERGIARTLRRWGSGGCGGRGAALARRVGGDGQVLAVRVDDRDGERVELRLERGGQLLLRELEERVDCRGAGGGQAPFVLDTMIAVQRCVAEEASRGGTYDEV